MFILSLLTFIVILIVSITFHEYSHGWVAYRLGDPTPKNFGRLTLNPLAHIDPFGTVILPIIFSLVLGFPIGYAKPVPVNPRYFKNPKKDFMWVGIAGPLANFILAFVLSVFLRMLPGSGFSDLLLLAIVVNLILALFNLIPIPPLDGSRILASFLPHKISYSYLKLQLYGFIFIIILINLGFFRWFIIPAVKFIFILFGIEGYSPF